MIQLVNPKGNQSWIFTERTDNEAEAPILWPPEAPILWSPFHWKRPWENLSLGRLRAGGQRGDREWDGWMASLTQWTWIWANSGRYWETEKPGMLHSVGSLRVRHDLMTKQQTATRSCYVRIEVWLTGMLQLVWCSIQTTTTFTISATKLFHLFIICVFTGVSLYSEDLANKISTNQQILKVGK